MEMDDFAEVVKKSHLVANDKTKIIFQLLQVLGAKGAVSDATMCGENRVSNQSPSKSVIQRWLTGKSKPGVSRYFPNLKVENEKKAHDFLRKTAKKDQWIELRDLFIDWYNRNQNTDTDFYVDTETDDFITFSTSFWRQFVSFFPPLRMWDDEEEQYTEKENNSFRSKIANEMIDTFKEEYMRYRIYEFIPKEINRIIDSLSIYYEILDERRKMSESIISDSNSEQKFGRMYCKWAPEFDYFIFNEVTYREGYWELRLAEKSFIRFRFDEDLDKVPTNTWLTTRFRYIFVDSSNFEDIQSGDEALLWKESKGDIIIINIDFPIDHNSLVDEDYFIIEDCYVLIDGMLALEYQINEFMIAVKEKIIIKYENINFDDNSRLLYNAIRRYRRLLKKFTKNLIKFRKLPKVKDEYLSDKALKENFGIYPAFHDLDISEKPQFPFSECYLDQDEADKVKSCLWRCHGSLLELYTEIYNFEESYRS